MPSWVVPYLIALVPSSLIMGVAVARILARAGEPAFPLDDSFIHLQFARGLAAGHFFEYVHGQGYASGATSFLWPLALAPFFAAGLDDLALVVVAWALTTLLHAGIAYEAWRFGRPLLGDVAALAAAAMCTVFGAFAWFAASGMETILLAWVLVRGVRVAAEAFESVASKATVQLSVLGFVAPLVRPEGALVSAIALVTLGLILRRKPGKRAIFALFPPSVGPLLVPLSHWFFTGHAASATAMVKHLAFDPYLRPDEIFAACLLNARLLVTSLLDGGAWTAAFVPERMVFAVALGVVALPFCAARRKLWYRAGLLLALALATFGPASYATLLWNRVRYIWPFAPAWFLLIAAACSELGARLLGGGPSKTRRFFGVVEPALAWGAVTLLAMKLDWATSDLATSARAISRQQVALGHWAKDTLPRAAVIGVNDTGAIAYLSRRATFDVVGLTTEGEARYWSAGAGPRYEHYERIAREGGRSRLPTHFIVYPQWMAMPAVLGEHLYEATVLDQSILGGRTMSAHVADYRLLDSGARPFSALPTDDPSDARLDAPSDARLDDPSDARPSVSVAPLGELDVADLESELAHSYELDDARAHFTVAEVGRSPSGVEIADGGRRERRADRFRVDQLRPFTLVMRVRSRSSLEVWADGARVGEVHAAADSQAWQEHAILLPNGAGEVVVRPTSALRFTSYHYWWFTK
ncbi:MAG: hypothetical protein EXR75_02055 [Myxococcales bacterium]|nr:hypothetical protein [Myxococcales bacterium]